MASDYMTSQSKQQLWRLYKELNLDNTYRLPYASVKKKKLLKVVTKLQIKQILKTNLIPLITKKQKRSHLREFFKSNIIPILKQKKYVMVIPNIILYDLSFGDDIDIKTIYKQPQIITRLIDGEKMTKSKIKILIDKFINKNNFYNFRFSNLDDKPIMDYSPDGIYYNDLYKTIPNDITASVKSLDDKYADLESLVVRDNKTAPIYHSIGHTMTKTSFHNECGLDQILKAIQGNKNFKNLTRDRILNEMVILNGSPIDRKNIQLKNIMNYLKSKNISYRIVNGQKRVISSFKRKQNIGRGGKTLIFMIQNDHIYLIEDSKLRSEIIYNNGAKPNTINWKNANICIKHGNISEMYHDLKDLNDNDNDNVVFITKLFDDTTKFPVHNLNLLTDIIYNKEQLIVENIKMDKYGNIISFSYKKKWIIYNPDYVIIKDILKKIQELDDIKNKKKFIFRNQTIQAITTDLINEFSGALPTSNLNLQVSNNLRKYPKIPYMESSKVISERQCHNAFSIDIRRCHTSILYNRHHLIGIFSPNNTIRKYRGEIIEGSMYFIDRHINLGSIKINKAFYDSQFISILLKEKFIDENDLTFEIVPSFTLKPDYFKLIIDKIYKILPLFAKDLINKFIGTLGFKDVKVINGELSTSEQFKNFWLSNKGLYKQVGCSLNLLYNFEVQDAINTNLPIYNGILDMSYYKLYEMEKRVKYSLNSYGIFNIQSIYIHSDSITFYSDQLKTKQNSNIVHNDTINEFSKQNYIRVQNDTIYDSDDEEDLIELNPFDILDQINSNISYNKNNLGIYRIERTDIPINITKRESENIQIHDINTKFIKRSNINELLTRNKSFSMFGEGGTGKTHNITNVILPKLKELKKKVIICSTSHKALDNLRKQGIACQTMASLFHLKSSQTLNNKLSEILKFDYIINDEYTMSSLKYMENFYTLYKQGMKFIFVGDYRQTTPIESRGNMKLNYRNSEFFKEMSDYNYKELIIQRRYDNTLRKVALNIYNNGILKIDRDNPISKRCKYNICYKNETRINGNKSFSHENMNKNHLKVDNDFIIIKGTPIICKVNEIDKGLFNNRIFEIKKWKEKVITIHTPEFYGDNNSQTLEIDIDTMKNKFQLAYYLTTHSAQGSTFDMEFEIHDTNSMSRNILYTAITRATSLNNVFINRYKKIDNIRKEYFTHMYKPRDISKKKFTGSVYELYDKITGEPFFIGSVEKSEGLNSRVLKHRSAIDSLDKVHTYISENNIKFNIREVVKIKYNDIDELHREEYIIMSLYVLNGETIYNIYDMNNIINHNPLREGHIAKKDKTLKGEISILKDRVVFRYYVKTESGSRRNVKSFRYTKKRSNAQALDQAKLFQLNYYS